MNLLEMTAHGFVERHRAGNPTLVLDADSLWESYADDFATHASVNDRPLSRGQLFRQLKAAGMRRFRSGAKNASGKRPYLYRIAPIQRSRRRGRIVDAVHAPSMLGDDWVA